MIRRLIILLLALFLLPVLVWVFAVLLGAAQEILRRYKEATHTQNLHYRGWMR